MKTQILYFGLALAALIFGPAAESRLLAQGPKGQVSLENVNYTGGDNTPGGTYGADSVAFSPDGKTLAAAYTDRDGTIRLWDVASGKNTATFKVGHAQSCSVAFSPDGKTLASGGAEIILWDVASAKRTATLGKGGWYLAFSPDGKTLASGGAEIILWDVASGKKTAALGKGGRSLAFSPDGKILASSPFVELTLPDRINPPNDPTPTIELWDVASGKSIAILKDEAAVWCVAFSADNKTLAAGGAETVRLWNVATGKKTATLKAATENMSRDCVRSVAFSADGKTVSAGSMCVIKFWNVATGERTANFTAHTHWVTSVAFTPDGKTFASTSYLGDNAPLVKLWNLSLSGPAQAQERGISGKWAGTGVNDGGAHFTEPLDITENEDGTLTGTGNGAPGKEMKILNGERVTAGVYQWEYATQTHRWRVRCTVKGKSLVLDYTCTWKEDGKVKGGFGTVVLTKLAPIAQEVAKASVLPKAAPIAQGQERQPEPDVPADLLKAQVTSSGEVYRLRLAGYRGGEPNCDLESTYLWSVRLLSAERDLSKKPADRVAAAAEHLERMKTVEATATARVKGGDAPRHHALAAEFYRVQAQIWLSQAKGK